ncbi:MAG: CSLREA domain-containing protein [Chloroflexales bacterium]|nr:CSLREA domain-containing protein [Chloroflexales bacterium]
MKRSFRLIIILTLLTISCQQLATTPASAREPSLRIDAPAQVDIGTSINVTLTLQDAEDLGGYETTLRFDPSAAHFNGLEHNMEAMRRIGRDIGLLGAIEMADGIAFGAYSCPVAECASSREGPRQDQGGQGTIELATITIIADQAGVLELSLAATMFVNAAGAPLTVAGVDQIITVQINAAEAGSHHPAPNAANWTGAGLAAADTGSFDLTGDGLVTNADVMEVALAWMLSREAGDPCGTLLDPSRDVNRDGCVNVADLQMVAANYSPDSPSTSNAGAVAEATFVVDSVADDEDATLGDGICATKAKECTLRAAIAEANLTKGNNMIAFAIPGDKVQTIKLQVPLPTINDETGAVTIDGYTQPGAKPNSDPLVSNAVIRVEITIAETIDPGTLEALHITSANNMIRGVAIFKFRRSILAFGPTADKNIIAGSFIGTDAAGTYAAAYASDGNGIDLRQGAGENQIGGSLPAERNVISGNPKNGIATHNGGSDRNVIIGNLIGLSPAGDKRLPNASFGIDINSHSSNNIIGGMTPGERNVISGNGGEGIEISHGERTVGNQVIGNFIGADVTGTKATDYSYNGAYGVHIEDGPVKNIVMYNIIGNNKKGGVVIDGYSTGYYPIGNRVYNNRIGISLDDRPIPNGKFGIQIAEHTYQSVIGPENIIAYNPIGIDVIGVDADFNTFTRNSIFGNTGLGIDIEPLGRINPNDVNDIDAGANQQLNFPVLTQATQYEVSGTACITCSVEIFLADGGKDAHGQGKIFVGQASANEEGVFTAPIGTVMVGDYVTATATDALGNTSEFAQNLRVVVAQQPPAPLLLYVPQVLR